MPGLLDSVFLFGFILSGFIFVLIPAWQIVKKAGFPAPLSLLLLVPLVNVAAIYLFAFSSWKVTPTSQTTTP